MFVLIAGLKTLKLMAGGDRVNAVETFKYQNWKHLWKIAMKLTEVMEVMHIFRAKNGDEFHCRRVLMNENYYVSPIIPFTLPTNIKLICRPEGYYYVWTEES